MLAVFLAAQLLQLVENRAENVGLVVRNLCVGEIFEAFRALNDARDALEAHAGVHVLGRQRRERAVRVGIELDEDEVPNFDAAGVAFVHQLAFGVAAGREVNVDFRARAARAGVAHHPKVVLLAAGTDVDLGVEPGSGEKFFPMVVGFLVEFGRLAGARVYRRWRRGVPAEIRTISLT